MRILYLAGRQSDALAVYEDTRRLLADRLGVDPSPALSAVHLAILRADPDLGAPAASGAGPPAGPARARAVRGAVIRGYVRRTARDRAGGGRRGPPRRRPGRSAPATCPPS